MTTMNNSIYILTDYKGNFGLKYTDNPYRSGFDKAKISELFNDCGYNVTFFSPASLTFDFSSLKGNILLYTSLEDNGLYYKSYIEDFVFASELAGALTIPKYAFLKAHENKVYFELLKNMVYFNIDNLKSWWFGAYEEFLNAHEKLPYPIVLKTYNGAMSRGVFLANNKSEALRISKKIMGTPNTFKEFKDIGRSYIHHGYIRDSWHRNKIIAQQFIPNLRNDWKILVYGDKYYVLSRGTKTGDFRASGQGLLSFSKDIPEGLLDFAKRVFELFNVPHISIDVAYDGKVFYLLEAQFIFFGTYTIEFSQFYFSKEKSNWECHKKKSCLEEEYVGSIIDFIKKL
jgi:hypothetical protein